MQPCRRFLYLFDTNFERLSAGEISMAMLPAFNNNNNSSKRSAACCLDEPPPKRKLPWLMSQATSHTMSRHARLDPLELAPPLNFFTPQRMVNITVIDDKDIDDFGGPKKQVFVIHHNVLAHYSIAFRRIINTSPKCHNMAFHSCEFAFGLLQNWFYTQEIESPTGTIKLMRYAKLWKLAKKLVIADLTDILLPELMATIKPGFDDDIGNTLKDFQYFAYKEQHRGLEDMAMSKTLSAINATNIDKVLKEMPDTMRSDFTLALMKGCVALPGWNKGHSFSSINVRSSHGGE